MSIPKMCPNKMEGGLVKPIYLEEMTGVTTVTTTIKTISMSRSLSTTIFESMESSHNQITQTPPRPSRLVRKTI